MGHGSQGNKRLALLTAMLLSTLPTAMAQVSLQQAMLRVSAQAVVAGSDPAYAPTVTVEAALQQLAGQAGVIFTGSVSAVEQDGSGGAKVRFAVEHGVRGVASGSSYTMHVSPWAGGGQRFYPGERALFLLTAPAVSGYSAPVMGERGVVPLSGDALVGNLDLRWVAADVQRNLLPATPTEASAELRAAAVPLAADTRGKLQQHAAAAPGAPAAAAGGTLPDVQSIDRDLVRDLLHAVTANAEQAR